MYSSVKNGFKSCWKPVAKYARIKKNADDDNSSDDEGTSIVDRLLQSTDLQRHAYGEFSLAVVQANAVLEDQSQVEARKDSTFVGVYDGHGGPDASRFVCRHLYNHLIRLSQEQRTISEGTITGAFAETESQFINHVRWTRPFEELIAAAGSCCLVGVIHRGTLFVANLGDSRAVMGTLLGSNQIVAEQLTIDHNANCELIRQELRDLHPETPDIVVERQGVWRVKGLIQISRSIGDAYLKSPEFAFGPSQPRFYTPVPITRAVLRSDPSISSRALRPTDRFVIFASDGLWEQITNQAAVEAVHKHPRNGIARRLVKMALKAAARKVGIVHDRLKIMEAGLRRNVHDDITVVVLFIEYEMLSRVSSLPDVSVRVSPDETGPSSSGANRAGSSSTGVDTAGPLGSGADTAGQLSSGIDTAGPLSSDADTAGLLSSEENQKEG